MKKILKEGFSFITAPCIIPHDDLGATEKYVLGFFLSNFTDRKTYERKKNVRWSKSTLQKMFHLGRRQLDTILASLQEKGYLDNNPITNRGTVFTLNYKGLELYEEIYKPFIQTPTQKKRKERKG